MTLKAGETTVRVRFKDYAFFVPKDAAGATVNDAVLAVCCGGLRRYLEAHAELPKAELAAVVPLGIGVKQGHTAASRRIAFGTHIADPIERLAWIHQQTAAPEPGESERGTPLPACTITPVPSPPAPMMRTLPSSSLFCPLPPTSLRMIWRE